MIIVVDDAAILDSVLSAAIGRRRPSSCGKGQRRCPRVRDGGKVSARAFRFRQDADLVVGVGDQLSQRPRQLRLARKADRLPAGQTAPALVPVDEDIGGEIDDDDHIGGGENGR